MTKTNFLSCSF